MLKIVRTCTAAVLACCGHASAAWAETTTFAYDAKGRVVRIVTQNTPYSIVTRDITRDKANNRVRVVTVAVPR